MEVTYNVSREDQTRQGLYLITHRLRPAADLVLYPFALAIFITFLSHKHGHISWTSGAILSEIFWTAILFIGLNVGSVVLANYALTQGSKDYPTAKRICTTSITADGVRDLTPEQDQMLVWKDVRSIRYHQGDIYFWKASGSIFVPKSAFADIAEAEQFYKRALEFWQNRTANGTTKSSIHTFDLKTRAELATRSIQGSAAGIQQDSTEKTLWEGKINRLSSAEDKAIEMTIIYLSSLFVLTSLFAVSTREPFVWQFVPWFWLATVGFYPLVLMIYTADASKVSYIISDQRVLASEQRGAMPTKFASVSLSRIARIQYFKPYAKHGMVSLGISTSAAIKSGTPPSSVISSITVTPNDTTATVANALATARNRRIVDFRALFSSQFQGDPFQEALNSDERILWSGGPEIRSFINETCGLKGGGATYTFLLAWIALLSYLDAKQVQPLWEKAALLLPLVILIIGLVLYRVRKRSQSAKSLFYAVTNQRLLLLDRSKPQYFAEADIALIGTIKYEESESGIGTFAFGGRYHNDIVFSFLTDFPDVKRIITEVRQEVSDTPIEWIDVAAERAKHSKPI